MRGCVIACNKTGKSQLLRIRSKLLCECAALRIEFIDSGKPHARLIDRVQQRGNLRLRWLSAGLTSILALAIWQSVQIKQRSKALELETTRANVEAKSAFALSEFWQTLFTNADPNLAKGRELTVKDVLGEAATKLHLSLKDAPQARARLQLTIAQTYRQLGDFAAAELAADGALDAVPHENSTRDCSAR